MKMSVKTFVAAGALAASAGMASASQVMSFTGTGGALPDGPNGVFSSSIVVPSGTFVQDMTVTLVGLTHTWAGDLRFELVKGSATAVMQHRPGQTSATSFGSSSDFNGNYTFTDSGGANMWANLGSGGTFVIPPGTYNNKGPWTSSAHNPPAGPPDNMAFANAGFLGVDGGGTWTLRIIDNASADVGSLGSWRLDIKIPGPASAGLLGLISLVGLRRRR